METNVLINITSILVCFQSFLVVSTFLGVTYFVGKYSRLTRDVEQDTKYTSKVVYELESKIEKVIFDVEDLKSKNKLTEDEYTKKIEDWLFSEE